MKKKKASEFCNGDEETRINIITQYLIEKGWNENISKEASEAYMKGGVQEVVKVAKWMNDTRNDYVSEITMDIAELYLKARNVRVLQK